MGKAQGAMTRSTGRDQHPLALVGEVAPEEEIFKLRPGAGGGSPEIKERGRVLPAEGEARDRQDAWVDRLRKDEVLRQGLG